MIKYFILIILYSKNIFLWGLIGLLKNEGDTMKQNILGIIDALGLKSLPILRYFLDNIDVKDNEMQEYIRGLGYYYNFEYEKAEQLFSTGFNSLKHFVRANFVLLKIFDAKCDKDSFFRVYKSLKEVISNLSKELEYDCRMNLAVAEMSLFNDSRRIDRLLPFRDKNRNAVLYYHKAIASIELKNDYEQGLKYIELSKNESQSSDSPFLKLMIMNAYISYNLKYKKEQHIVRLVQKMAFLIGYWFDIQEYMSLPSVFYTVAEISGSTLEKDFFKKIIEELTKKEITYFQNGHRYFISENFVSESKLPLLQSISHIRDLSLQSRIRKNQKIICETQYEKGWLKRAEEYLKLFDLAKREKFIDFYLSSSEKPTINRFITSYPIYKSYNRYIEKIICKKKFHYTFFENTCFDPIVATITCSIWNLKEKKSAVDIIENMINYVFS